MHIKAIKFIIISFALFLLLLAAYFSVINFWLAAQHPEIPTSYKEFLLVKTQGAKIIIDSGSNSHYGVDPFILEKAFKMPVINLADNASYPLAHKFRYLSRYANSGDIIVLPLEWENYGHKPFYDNYVLPALDGRLSYYYQSLELSERLNFVFKHVPMHTFVAALKKRSKHPINIKYKVSKLKEYQRRLARHNGNSLGSGLQPIKLGAHDSFTLKNSCDEALFTHFTIDKQFLRDIKILKATRANNVTVIFTWPVAVDKEGNGCYQSPRVRSHLKKYVTNIKKIILANGFIIIGEPSDSVFSSNDIYDTFYHVTESAAQIRTTRLAARMQQAGIQVAKGRYQPGDSIEQLSTEVIRLLKALEQPHQ